MASSQVDALAILIEAAIQVEEAARPSPGSIKIRFKKGALSAKSADEGAGEDSMTSPVLIHLGAGSEKKRKAVEDNGLEIEEHPVKHVKAETSSEAMKSGAISGSFSMKKATSPVGSMVTTATSTGSPKKVPAQPASIYRKFAKKLSTQPVLLEHLKEYRTSITSQHREDLNLIASLRAELGSMKKAAAEKELRAAEELKASQDMVAFWTDSCNDEYEATMLLKERLRDVVDQIEDIANADAMGDVNAGFSKGMQIEFELQKLGAELSNLVDERKERMV